MADCLTFQCPLWFFDHDTSDPNCLNHYELASCNYCGSSDPDMTKHEECMAIAADDHYPDPEDSYPGAV